MFWLMSIVALSSLVLGNVMAYTQTSTKRLLSYSSIVQAGFILIGFLQLKQEDSWPIIYYLIAYCLASLICFFVCYFVENQNGSDHIDEFEGLFFAKMGGPGTVWLQSLPFSRLASRVFAAAPQRGGAREEGSILPGVAAGGLLGGLLGGSDE